MPDPTTESLQVRYVVVRDRKYLYIEDVVNLLQELAATEETDTRNRINALAQTLEEKTK